MWAETLFSFFPEVYMFGEVYWFNWSAWLSLLFCVSSLWTFDIVLITIVKAIYNPDARVIFSGGDGIES